MCSRTEYRRWFQHKRRCRRGQRLWRRCRHAQGRAAVSRQRSVRERMPGKIRRTRGQATIEAAFALPVLMLLILMLLQPSILLYDRIVMQSAAAEGCRLLATSDGSSQSTCEDFLRRRLSAIPQVDFFHVHTSGCTWQISMSGNESSATASVRISTEVKPLPLIGLGAGFLGLTGANGNLTVEAEANASTQPPWYQGG